MLKTHRQREKTSKIWFLQYLLGICRFWISRYVPKLFLRNALKKDNLQQKIPPKYSKVSHFFCCLDAEIIWIPILKLSSFFIENKNMSQKKRRTKISVRPTAQVRRWILVQTSPQFFSQIIGCNSWSISWKTFWKNYGNDFFRRFNLRKY